MQIIDGKKTSADIREEIKVIPTTFLIVTFSQIFLFMSIWL